MTALINISEVTAKSLKQKKLLKNFPEYYELAKITENGLWHDHQNVLDHVILVYESLESLLEFNGLSNTDSKTIKNYLSELIENKSRIDILKIATLLHDIAKSETITVDNDGITHCPNHESIGAEKVVLFSKRFVLGVKDALYVERIVKFHGYVSQLINAAVENGNNEEALKLLTKATGDVSIESILLAMADVMGSDLVKRKPKTYDEYTNILKWMLRELLTKLR